MIVAKKKEPMILKEIEVDILCNIKKHEPCLDIYYKELQNIKFVQSDEEEDSSDFSIINPSWLDLDLEDRDNVSNALLWSTMIDKFTS